MTQEQSRPALLNCHRRVAFRSVGRIGTRGAFAALALAVSGCATTRYAPVHCVSPQQLQKLKDAEPPKIGSRLTGQAQDDLKIIAGNNVELRQYGHGLLSVIEGCSGS